MAEPPGESGPTRTVIPAVLPVNALKKMGSRIATNYEPERATAQGLAFPPTARGEEGRLMKSGVRDADDHHGREAATPLRDEATDPDGALNGQGACRCVSSGCPASYLF